MTKTSESASRPDSVNEPVKDRRFEHIMKDKERDSKCVDQLVEPRVVSRPQSTGICVIFAVHAEHVNKRKKENWILEKQHVALIDTISFTHVKIKKKQNNVAK